MKTLYKKVSRQLERIDFEALWPGFHPYPFALYDSTYAVLDGRLISRPDNFRGNTTVVFEGRQIAIWNVGYDLPEDEEQFASKLVHEMFHAFQMERKETRFPNDLLLAGTDLTPEYLALKAEEYRCLTKPGGLPRFRALRERRRALNPGCIREELLAETAEGMAQYIELCALGQLAGDSGRTGGENQAAGGRRAENQAEHRRRDEDKAADGQRAKDQAPGGRRAEGKDAGGRRDGERLQAALAECASRLADPGLLPDSRRCAYDSGSLLLFAARREGLTLFHDIGGESRSVYDILLPQIPQADCPVSLDGEMLAPWIRVLSERTAQREQLIRAFLQEAHTTVNGCFRICGYDPMNLWREGNRLYSTSFLALAEETGNIITLTGRALLQMLPGSPDTVLAYSTAIPDT